MAIDNLQDLSNTVNDVVNRILEIVTENSSSSQRYVSYDDVEDLISEEDYRNFFPFIENELRGREEVLDLDCADFEFDVICGLAWCKAYEPGQDEGDIEFGYLDLQKSPSMARLAEIGQKVMEHIVLEDIFAEIDPGAFGIKEGELDYIRSITGYNRSEYDENGQMLSLASIPVTTKSYEELIALSVQQKADIAHAQNGPQDKTPLALEIYVNDFGQMDHDAFKKYPEARDVFDRFFDQPSDFSGHRCGVMISGAPALMFSYEVDAAKYAQYGGENSDFYHGAVAMMAGQLNGIFEPNGAHVTFGRGTGENEMDEIMAFVPATAEPKLLHKFETALDKALHDLPFTQDLDWSKKQYDTISSQLKTILPESRFMAPWGKEHPQAAVMSACEEFGHYLGVFHNEWSQAVKTHDQKKMDRLSDFFDLSNQDGVSNHIYSGLYTADMKLDQRVRLYTSDNPRSNESFTLPKGQLMLAMEQMGYEKGTSVASFLSHYSPEAAKEVKSIVDQMPKRSFDQQVKSAQQRKQQGMDQNKFQAQEKEQGR